MSTRDINTLRDELLKNRIELSDTISQFMEKCNNNFSAIVEWGGNPDGTKGEKGDQGVPTKPKVPIHVWRKGPEYEYNNEAKSPDGGFEIYDWNEDLSDVKYQEGHLIMLENANIYILESDNNFNLKPKYIVSLNSYNSDSIVDGRNAYVHFAYADSPDGKEGFKTDQELRKELGETESSTTFSLTRGSNSGNSVVVNKPYMGVYSDNTQDSMREPRAYTWFRVRGNDGSNGANGSDGAQGPQGPKGEKGEKGDQGDPGDAFTGHPYTIDLEGDMSTISIDIDRTRLYDKSGDYCKCIAHAYYGDENIKIDISKETTKVEVRLPEEYKYSDEIPNRILKVEDNSVVGVIEIKQANNDVDVEIKFTPDEEFKFPKKTILFTVHIEDSVYDKDDGNTYNFVRDTVWMIKGIMSTFELEIMPHYRSIKLFENGDYYPENLLVDVYKVEDSERTIFNFGQNPDFTLLYKDYNNNKWETYPSEGVSTKGVSCLEFKVVRYLNSTDPLKPEEIWDYEDVWVVADGKSTHYYHADLGSAESMMVLTTGEKININPNENEDPLYCAKLRNEDGYSITFDLKFYDGTEELKVVDVDIYQSGADSHYYNEGTFKREIDDKITIETEIINGVEVTKYKSTFTVTSVPYNVEMIPMTFTVTGEVPVYDSSGIVKDYIYEKDTISFNVYISTLTNTYTLIPTVSAYNTSTGKDGDKIGCNVYKNDVFIDTPELSQNGLLLEYIVYDGSPEYDVVTYTEPLIYGDDSDIEENEFAAKDVAIEFILSYNGNEVAKSTVPLIKDGIDGRDGDSWQYIFCRSPYYKFERTGISNPANWTKDPNSNDSNSEYLGEKENDYPDNPNLRWYDDHKGIDSTYRYEYQSYRKWDKDNKCWGPYGEPTLYSNYSESGSGYSALLSNPVAIIPVGSDWRTEEGNDNQYDSTLVYLYNNTSDISENANVSISIDIPANDPHYSHFTIPKKDENNKINKVNFTPVVYNEETGEVKSIFEFNQNTPYKVPIKLTYTLDKDNDNDATVDNFVTTINWTLTPITGLEDVEVFVDQRVVNNSIGSQHTLRVGYYLISTNNSKQFIEEDNEDNIKGYKIILTNNIKNLTPDDPDATIKNVVLAEYWTEVEYDFANNNRNRNCYVVLVEPYTNESGTVEYNIIDYTDVTSVSDGKSSIHLELTQDHIVLPCDAEGGGVHRDYKDNITAQMKLYNGDVLIEGNIQYYFRKNNDTTDLTQSEDTIQMVGNDGTFKISPKIINGDTNIKCIAEYNDIFYYKVLFIDLEETPYELEINKNVLTRDVNIGDGIILDDEITVSVKCWMKGDWQYINYGEVIATTNNEETTDSFSSPTGSKMVRTLTITGSNLRSNKSDTNVKISFKYNGEELSYETIGIINGGRDGEAPTLLSTTRIGFSLKEDEDINDNSKWDKTLDGDKYKNSSPGTPIYVLYERIWIYDNGTEHKERYVTATLSGSQGTEGKSRVLFYRGSFDDRGGKIPTLKGENITGVLDDDRCDYYIDKNGQAWMRTGNETNAVGLPSGNSGDPNWKISETVGFIQAGAIHADMINTGSITAGSGFVDKLFSADITATKLKVNSAQITGDLEGKTIKSDTECTYNDDIIPTWQINNTGDGWLASHNIWWTEDGELHIGGGSKEVSLGDTWILTNDGIKSTNNTAEFNHNGSGQIGGYYKNNKNEDTDIKKGMSWNKDGDVTFHNKLITKPEYIVLTGSEDKENPPTIVIKSEASTYVFIEKTESEPSTYNFNENDYYYVYLGWFNGMFGKIALDNDTLCNFTLINHTNKALKLYINENNITLPFRKTQDWILPQYNYKLMQNDTFGTAKSIIQTIYILPGSKLELCLENYNDTHMFYIDNISDFRLCYDSTIFGDETTVARTRSLVSTNYDLNTYNNGGGYGHMLSEKFSPRKQYLHLIFGNSCSGAKGSFAIPYYNIMNYLTGSTSSNEYVSMNAVLPLNANIDSNYYEKYDFNEVYKKPIEFTCGFSSIDTTPFIIKLHITDYEGINILAKKYTKVQLICYSILYDTIYKGDIIEIELNKDFDISLTEDDFKTLIWLAGNQQNPILDILVKINFIE